MSGCCLGSARCLGSCAARGERLGLAARLPKTGFPSRRRASLRDIVENRTVTSKPGIHVQCLLVSYRPLAQALCRRFARATIDARGRRGDTCNVIGTPPRISTEPTRATPPLVRGIKAITSGNASRGASEMIKGVIIVPPRHRCDACSMAWRCRFLTARRSQDGRVIAEN